MAETKYVVRKAGGIGIVFLDAQVRLMVKLAVEHVGCVTHRGINDFGMKGRITVREMRIEDDPRTTAVTSVDLASVFAVSTDVRILSVGRLRKAKTLSHTGSIARTMDKRLGH